MSFQRFGFDLTVTQETKKKDKNHLVNDDFHFVLENNDFFWADGRGIKKMQVTTVNENSLFTSFILQQMLKN